MRASIGFLSPKNKIDHNIFNISCMLKKSKAFFTSCGLLWICAQTSPALMPMRMKSVVQATGNAQFGGLKFGLISVGYQLFTLLCVICPET